MQREHDMKVKNLKARQKDMERRLAETAVSLQEYKKKEKMAEAQKYLTTLENIQATINDFMEEAS